MYFVACYSLGKLAELFGPFDSQEQADMYAEAYTTANQKEAEAVMSEPPDPAYLPK